NIRKIVAELAGDLVGRRHREPDERAMYGAGHRQKLVLALLEHAAARDEGGVGGEATGRRGVPDMTSRRDQALGMRLEDMDGVERARAQRRLVLLHGAVG